MSMMECQIFQGQKERDIYNATEETSYVAFLILKHFESVIGYLRSHVRKGIPCRVPLPCSNTYTWHDVYSHLQLLVVGISGIN